MKIELAGKRALVTGSTLGIGYAIAKGLLESGAAVIINGRTEQKVAAAVKKLAQEVKGAEVYGVAADLGTAAGAQHVINEVDAVDILINNVGIFAPVRSLKFLMKNGKIFSK